MNSNVSRRDFIKGSALGAAALGVGGVSMGLTGCGGNGNLAEITFENVTESLEGLRFEGNMISMTEERSFKVTVPFEGKSVEDIQGLIDGDKISWTLAREAGSQDPELWPHQYLGGALDEWMTVPSVVAESQNMFEITNLAAEDIDGVASLVMTMDCKMLYGIDGIDNRDRRLVRNSMLDYHGEYTLTCVANGKDVAACPVQMRAYDYYRTQDDIIAEIDDIAAECNENGIFAKVEQIGHSCEDRPVKAVFVCKQESDLDDYLALVERAESDPAAVQAEIAEGKLSYKIPMVYSNIHPDEIVGCDGVMEFFRRIAKNEPISYKAIASLTEAGTTKLHEEMKEDKKAWSSLIGDKVTGVGYIQGDGIRNPYYEDIEDRNPDIAVDLSPEEFAQYYNLEDRTFDISAILDDVFFILVPSENPDGRYHNTRTCGHGFDLNRDNTYQLMPEVQAMTGLIAKWNPISLHEIHGYYSQFQVEPCSPTHDPNNEYDLFIDDALREGEAFISTAIANNAGINSVQMPMRDYLCVQEDGSVFWEEPFDDLTSAYTPQYAMLQGVNAYTVELPFGNQDAVEAITYGFIGNAAFIAENKDVMYTNQLERYRRGIENIDTNNVRKWYVSQDDIEGACADEFRPRHAENGNFFAEAYVIPMGADQKNRHAASDMIDYLIHNDVKVQKLNADVTLPANGFRGELNFHAGDMLVDFHQAKRNMANTVLDTLLVVDDWSGLYSEPVTNFPYFRGFDAVQVLTPGAFENADTEAVTEAPAVESVVEGDGDAAILLNNGLDAIQAVNALLADKKNVGIITEGELAGNYVMSASDLDAVASEYVLNATKTSELPSAKKITPGIKAYVPGFAPAFEQLEDGTEYGVKNYVNILDYTHNWDKYALTLQMGFEVTDSFDEANIAVGQCALTEDEAAAVIAGEKPYVGFGLDSLYGLIDGGMNIDFNDEAYGDYDALTTMEFVNESPVTDVYRTTEDNIIYGHGGEFFNAVPEGAKPIMQASQDEFLEGFMDAEHVKGFKGSVQAVEFDDKPITLFANSLTNKAHQQHEYRLLTAAIYSKFFDGDFAL